MRNPTKVTNRDQQQLQKLEDFLYTLPLDDNNAVINLCCRLSSIYERKAILDGLKYGAQLIQELQSG